MSVNYYKPYVKILPEDKADSDLATGFLLHEGVGAGRQVQILRYAGGYPKVLQQLKETYFEEIRSNSHGHLVLVIDFDQSEGRLEYFTESIPEDLRDRIFVLGSWTDPEALRKFGGSEGVGRRLASDCYANEPAGLWLDDLLKHNLSEKSRMGSVRKLLFG